MLFKEMEIVDRRSSYGTLPAPVFQQCAEWRLKTSAKNRKRLTERLAVAHGADFAKDVCHQYVQVVPQAELQQKRSLQLCELVERSIADRYYRSRRINPRYDDEWGRRLHAATEKVAHHLRLIEDPAVLSNSRSNVKAEHFESGIELSKKLVNFWVKLNM